MTTRTCLAKLIPALWSRRTGLLACLVLWIAAPLAGQAGLAGLARAYRESPTPVHRAALESYAAAHARDNTGSLARLALGIAAYEQKDYSAAIAALQPIQSKLPEIADYAAYYLAAARLESNDVPVAAKDLAPAHAAPSPLSGKAWLVEARALKISDAAGAARLLRDRYAELPQPDGDLTLADCYQAANDLPNAADFYQRVYYQYVTGDAANRSAAALLTLKDVMGAGYPAPLPEQMLRRADRWMELREYVAARSEYQALLDRLVGPERDQARVRMGAADFLSGNAGGAYAYLRDLEVAAPEAAAERQYYLEEWARRLNNDDGMMAAIKELAASYPKSLWRLKAMVSAANRYLLVNRPDDYIPLYQAAYQDFPTAPVAALCHWKVTFHAYLHGARNSGDLLAEHLRDYSAHFTAGAALYFLGRNFEQQSDFAAARDAYRLLAKSFENHYYAMLARERLRSPEIAGVAKDGAAKDRSAKPAASQWLSRLKFPAPQPVPSEGAATTARIQRSRLLRTAGLDDLADSELRFGVRTDGQPALLAMELAGAADAPHRAMRLMKSLTPDYLNLPVEDAPRKFWELLFPLPYRDDLVRTARERELNPFLLAGLIRQESEFNPEAISPAKAYGLTQVRPATGRQFARQAGIQRFTTQALYQPAVNLKIGSFILRGMLDYNSGSLERTLASYNAGPNRVAEWLSWNTYREPAEFVESIPFTETRDYVQAVLRNAEMYRRLYENAAGSVAGEKPAAKPAPRRKPAL
jgi:soluble lytic murein transglycosylase